MPHPIVPNRNSSSAWLETLKLGTVTSRTVKKKAVFKKKKCHNAWIRMTLSKQVERY